MPIAHYSVAIGLLETASRGCRHSDKNHKKDHKMNQTTEAKFRIKNDVPSAMLTTQSIHVKR
jgi:hypothetical protein